MISPASRIFGFERLFAKIWAERQKTMLNLRKFHQDFHPLLAKMREKYFDV